MDPKIMPEVYEYGFNDGDTSVLKIPRGLSRETVEKISAIKDEPEWLRAKRLQAYEIFTAKSNPKWGPDLSFINFDDYVYYSRSSAKSEDDWEKVPQKIKDTFAKIGIIESEAKYLNGVVSQYDSEPVYHSLLSELAAQNVIFTDTDTAAREHPELFQKYFGTLVPAADNKYAALNTAVWSGGTFIYVPPGVHIEKPLQSYFRINAKNAGQFERTLIIVDEGASVHYIEGCTAPIYDENNLHAAVVEVFVGKNAHCRYTTIQNWSDNVLNLVTKRAMTDEGATMTWVDGNIGARLNMKYPCTVLRGDYSKGKCISIAVAKDGVTQDSGAKMIHIGKHTQSKILAKGISDGSGRSNYRGLVKIARGADYSQAFVECDTLLLKPESKSDTFPTEILQNQTSSITHEAKVSKVSDEQIFYLMSKGLSRDRAEQLIVIGFLDEFSRELPMEYAVELNQLLKLDLGQNG